MGTQLFELASIHRSFALEHGRVPNSERLEFLGDAVLQIVVIEHIFRSFPDLAGGQLAKLRTPVVSSHTLAEVARGLDPGELTRLGRGEINTRGVDKISTLANTIEAVIDAIHMFCGVDAIACFVHALLDERTASGKPKGYYTDHKTALQEYCAHNGLEPPRCEIVGEGLDYQRVFTTIAMVGGRAVGPRVASSRKCAEQLVVREACRSLLPDA